MNVKPARSTPATMAFARQPAALQRRRARMTVLLATLLALVLIVAQGERAMAALPATDDGPPPATPQLIDQAFVDGEITAETRLLYLAYAVYRPELLPAEFQSNTPWFGTAVVAELNAAADAYLAGPDTPVAAAAADELSRLLRTNAAATVCDQKDLANTLASTHFYLNYGTIGGGPTAQDYSDSLETAFDVLVTQYGWAEPPLTVTNLGGYPVQVAALASGLYGYVTSSGGSYTGWIGDNPNTSATESAAVASCMVLNEDYSGFGGTPQQALDATTSHELAHAIQFGYGDPAPFEDNMWYESMAAYVEDEPFDDANDNYGYLYPPFTRCLGKPPSTGTLVYANWLFFRYAAEQNGGANTAGGGEELFEDFWAAVAQGARGLDAYNSALAVQGSALNTTFHSYAIASAFMQSCPDSTPYCYEEAAAYVAAEGALPATQGQINAVGDAFDGQLEDHFALNWIELPTSGAYHVTLENLGSGGSFRVSVVAQTPTGLTVESLPNPVGGSESQTLSDFTPPVGATRVLAVITNEATSSGAPRVCTAHRYRLSLAESATVPIGVGYFLAEGQDNMVDFIWQTATETQNAGFNLYGEIGEELVQLNDLLIQSTVIDSVEPTDYSYSAATSATSFYIEDVSLDGKTEQTGPFALGEAYGVYVLTAEELTPAMYMPLIIR